MREISPGSSAGAYLLAKVQSPSQLWREATLVGWGESRMNESTGAQASLQVLCPCQLTVPQACLQHCVLLQGSGEVSATGYPYGFYRRPMPAGFAPGFPTVIDSTISQNRALDVLNFLSNGQFLDDFSEGQQAGLQGP